jgi:glycosyltransferase involved in cell wall biosynthesis
LARYHQQKNILRFLEAVSILNQKYSQQIEYYWYGSAYGSEYFVQCEDLRTKLSLENVYFQNFVNDVSDVFEEIDAVCLPSLYEGFSNTLSEAICAGKPILASTVGDNGFLVQDGYNGFLFNPYDVKEIAEAIKKLLCLTEDKSIEFQQNSRNIAERLFSKSTFINNYFKVLF